MGIWEDCSWRMFIKVWVWRYMLGPLKDRLKVNFAWSMAAHSTKIIRIIYSCIASWNSPETTISLVLYLWCSPCPPRWHWHSQFPAFYIPSAHRTLPWADRIQTSLAAVPHSRLSFATALVLVVCFLLLVFCFCFEWRQSICESRIDGWVGGALDWKFLSGGGVGLKAVLCSFLVLFVI